MATTDYPNLPRGVRVAKLKLGREYDQFGIVAGWSVTSVPADFTRLDPRARELGIGPDFRVDVANLSERYSVWVEMAVTEEASKTLGVSASSLSFELEAPLGPLDSRHDADTLRQHSDFVQRMLLPNPRLLAAWAAHYLGAKITSYLDARLPQA